jgi:hypothetical protein
MRVQPWGGNPALECVVADETGSVVVVFFGRRSSPVCGSARCFGWRESSVSSAAGDRS